MSASELVYFSIYRACFIPVQAYKKNKMKRILPCEQYKGRGRGKEGLQGGDKMFSC